VQRRSDGEKREECTPQRGGVVEMQQREHRAGRVFVHESVLESTAEERARGEPQRRHRRRRRRQRARQRQRHRLVDGVEDRRGAHSIPQRLPACARTRTRTSYIHTYAQTQQHERSCCAHTARHVRRHIALPHLDTTALRTKSQQTQLTAARCVGVPTASSAHRPCSSTLIRSTIAGLVAMRAATPYTHAYQHQAWSQRRVITVRLQSAAYSDCAAQQAVHSAAPTTQSWYSRTCTVGERQQGCEHRDGCTPREVRWHRCQHVYRF
jgi:hypothetical protein